MGSFQDLNRCTCHPEGAPLIIEYSRMGVPESFFAEMEGKVASAFAAMRALESGAIANPDENRMVGHYWLRAPELAPNEQLRGTIERDIRSVKAFAADVHAGKVTAPGGEPFRRVLIIGIGGSALGPQLMADALSWPERDRLVPLFFDNTDPAGMSRVLEAIGDDLDSTLVIVISKSGGTAETRNGMLVAEAAFRSRGLHFPGHAVAVTGEGSQLDQHAQQHGFLGRFPMYDWVGGRTSVMSCVGLLPAALQGIDVDDFLAGARRMDAVTRLPVGRENPAMLLALLWHYGTNGRGEKDMVVLPYADRLLLFSRYLQQLIMESLGKELDLDGNTVHQGISVYGNKGSTDQHAYVQQLREGVPNFFALFIEVLHKGPDLLEVDPGVHSADYLNGFYLGTREALSQKGRQSLTISIPEVDPFILGALIALFERTVGYYASLVNINAYHQPGVEAGKKAAAQVLKVQGALLSAMQSARGKRQDAFAWTAVIGESDVEMAYHVLRHLSHNRGNVHVEGRGTAMNFWMD